MYCSQPQSKCLSDSVVGLLPGRFQGAVYYYQRILSLVDYICSILNTMISRPPAPLWASVNLTWMSPCQLTQQEKEMHEFPTLVS